MGWSKRQAWLSKQGGILVVREWSPGSARLRKSHLISKFTSLERCHFDSTRFHPEWCTQRAHDVSRVSQNHMVGHLPSGSDRENCCSEFSTSLSVTLVPGEKLCDFRQAK